MAVEIRQAKLEDITTLSALALTIWNQYSSKIKKNLPVVETDWVARHTKELQEKLILVAYNQGSMVGYLKGTPPVKNEMVTIEYVGVDPQFQKRGIGTFLAKSYVERAMVHLQF